MLQELPCFLNLHMTILLQARGPTETPWEAMLLPPWPVWRALQQESINSLLLIAFTSEGVGNTSEAAVLASLVQATLEMHGARASAPSDWKAPISWSHLFGNSPIKQAY